MLQVGIKLLDIIGQGELEEEEGRGREEGREGGKAQMESWRIAHVERKNTKASLRAIQVLSPLALPPSLPPSLPLANCEPRLDSVSQFASARACPRQNGP